MLNVTNYQGNTNQNHDAITSLPLEWLFSKRPWKSAGRIWRKGNVCVLLAGMGIGAATVGNRMEFPQKSKTELFSDPEILLLGINLEKTAI